MLAAPCSKRQVGEVLVSMSQNFSPKLELEHVERFAQGIFEREHSA